ncbi:hypothetical protein IFR05_004980 [Cadophora sp. M221]|nr:hypothetical protein IFR05_004980 [Cadophora sp. M221]
MSPQVPPRPFGPRRAPRCMQEMAPYQYAYGFNDSAENLPAIGEFPAMEAVYTLPSMQNIPIIPSKRPRMRRSHRAMRGISTASSNSSPRLPAKNSELADSEPSILFTSPGNSFPSRETWLLYESPKSSAISTSTTIPGPVETTPHGSAQPNELAHIDSGFNDDAGQQQTHNRMNRPNSMGSNGNNSMGIMNSTEDDISETEDIDAYTSTHSNTNTAPVILSRIDKCLQEIKGKIEPIRRFVEGSPLRLRHNIMIWEWEREQKKLDRSQNKRAKKAIKKEQTAHVNFERDQSRTAKKYVKEMRDREVDVWMDYGGEERLSSFAVIVCGIWGG